MKILTASEVRKQMKEFLATTRYVGEEKVKRDRHGMPIVPPDPEDPDDE